MRRRAGGARSAEMRVRLRRSPTDTRTRLRVGPDTREFAEAIGATAAATTLRALLAALVAALKLRIEAPALAQHLAIDHHRDEEKRQVQQRELVDLPRWLGPFLGRGDTDNSHKQNAAEQQRGDEVDDSKCAK